MLQSESVHSSRAVGRSNSSCSWTHFLDVKEPGAPERSLNSHIAQEEHGHGSGTSCHDRGQVRVAGNWGAWTDVSECSTTCGIGRVHQERRCDQPAPKHGGAECPGISVKTVPCNTKIRCPGGEENVALPIQMLKIVFVSGNWGAWTDVSECSTTCGIGRVHQERRCDQSASKHGGAECPGISVKTVPCNTKIRCPGGEENVALPIQMLKIVFVSGNWGAWTDVSECSTTCGIGRVHQERRCDQSASKHGGAECPGISVKTVPCNTKIRCPADVSWSPWGNWASCSHSCQEEGAELIPVRRRTRVCSSVVPSSHPPVEPCPGSETEIGPCDFLPACPISGNWGAWTDVSECSTTCGIGGVHQERRCDQSASKHGGAECPGISVKTVPCNTKIRCPADVSWSPWGNWASCSHSCQEEGAELIPVRRRTRVCSSVVPSSHPPVEPCPGSETEIGPCDFLPACPTHGSWSPWGRWASCGQTCQEREPELIPVRRRTRLCNNPAPSVHPPGEPCPGRNTESSPCDFLPFCSIDGSWTAWSVWTDCARSGRNISCQPVVGQQRRTRRCVGRQPAGKPCPGSIVDVHSCYNNDNCWYGKGIWSVWNSWSLCHPPCGALSFRKRTRTCEPNFPDYPKESGVNKKVPIFFWGNPIFDCEELYGERKVLEDILPCLNVPECN
ncbi:properdin-like [Mustelus asterias]